MSRSRSSPRKFSEKIALLNKREADTTAEFVKIIQEVEATTRAGPPSPKYHHQYPQQQQSPTLTTWTNNSNEPNTAQWIDQDSNSACNEQPQQQQQVAYYSNGYDVGQPSPIDESQLQFQHQIHHQDPQQHQQHLQHQTDNHIVHYQQQTTSSHMGIVPNIEISHTDEDITTTTLTTSPYYQQFQTQQQQVSHHHIVPNDQRSGSISAARSLPDIANLRVNSPTNDCLSSSYSDQRLRSNTISGNNNHHYDMSYNNVQSNDVSQDGTYFCSQQQTTTADPGYQQQPPVVMMDNQQPSPGTYNEYYHTSSQQQQPQSSMVRANSYNAVMDNWSNNNTLNTPKINNMFSRSSDDCCGNLENLDLDSSSNLM